MTLGHNFTRRAAAVLLVGAAAAIPSAAQANERCVGIAEQHLQDLGIAASAIEKTSMVKDYANLEMGTTRRFEAWTDIKSCDGSLVTKLNTSCRVIETYGRGSCRVEDVARK